MADQFPFHYSKTVELKATPQEAFDFLDDPKKLSSHMGKSSVMMAGSKMEMKLDDQKGRGVGAEIILEGKMMGIPLFVREFVIERIVPSRKIWQTRGPQKLVILDQYKMGFGLSAQAIGSKLEVFIDFCLPKSGVGAILGKFLAPTYARWCTHKMAEDAAAHFSRVSTESSSKNPK